MIGVTWAARGLPSEVLAEIAGQTKVARDAHPHLSGVIASAKDALVRAVQTHGSAPVQVSASLTFAMEVGVSEGSVPVAEPVWEEVAPVPLAVFCTDDPMDDEEL